MGKKRLKNFKIHKVYNKMFNKNVLDSNHLWENQFLIKFHGLINKKDYVKILILIH